MNIAMACDHGGFALKNALIAYAESLGHTVHDFGCYNTESMDYSDVAFPACEAVAGGAFDRGVVICTTGIGMCIAANKVRGIRCSLCCNLFTAEMTRRHNDANVLALGAKVVDEALACEILATWLKTEFDGGRHARRVGKISDYENKCEGERTCQTK